jgi:hypothetical protein
MQSFPGFFINCKIKMDKDKEVNPDEVEVEVNNLDDVKLDE